jgi:predicted transcriptional regulator
MRLEEVRQILDAEVVSGSEHLNTEVSMACGADLMSDVLAFIKQDSLLVTGLTNPQVIRTAEMVDVKAICFVRGKRPGEDTIRLAERKSIPLLLTRLPMFEACGRLYSKKLPGCSETE